MKTVGIGRQDVSEGCNTVCGRGMQECGRKAEFGEGDRMWAREVGCERGMQTVDKVGMMRGRMWAKSRLWAREIACVWRMRTVQVI